MSSGKGKITGGGISSPRGSGYLNSIGIQSSRNSVYGLKSPHSQNSTNGQVNSARNSVNGLKSPQKSNHGYVNSSRNSVNGLGKSGPMSSQNSLKSKQSSPSKLQRSPRVEKLLSSSKFSAKSSQSSNYYARNVASGIVASSITLLDVSSSSSLDSVQTIPSSSSSMKKPSKRIDPRSTLPPIPEVVYDRSYAAANEINKIWRNTEIKDIGVNGISKILRHEFYEAKNPFAMSLDLMVNSTGFFHYKYAAKFLSMDVMQEFKKWVKEQEKIDERFHSKYLKLALQICAFEIVLRQRSPGLVKLVFEIFQLSKIGKEFITYIKQFCSNGQYKEACLAAEALELHDQFDIHAFVLPLILQDRESFAMDYMLGSETVQEGVMDFLDGIVGQGKEKSHAYFRDYVMSRKIEEVNFDKLEPRPLSKLISRLASRFSVDFGITNTAKQKRLGMIRHIFHRMYDLKEPISKDAFQEMLDATVGTESDLVEEVMLRFGKQGDDIAAAEFVIRNNYPPSKCSYNVQVELNKINPQLITVEPPKEFLWDQEWDITEDEIQERKNQRYLQAMKGNSHIHTPLTSKSQASREINNNETVLADMKFYKCPDSHIHLVDTASGVKIFLNYVERASTSLAKMQAGKGYAFGRLIAGIDCEWKPTVTEISLGYSGVALVQIAMAHDIFLLDIYKLINFAQEGVLDNMFEQLVKQFFANEEIIKVGYSFDSDFRKLSKTTLCFRDLKYRVKSLLDLSVLSKQFKSTPTFFIYTSENTGLTGLNELVFICTGKRVNKEEQFSDWEKRPLRQPQVQYAATDAYCLLEIFETMRTRARELGIDFEHLVKLSLDTHNNTEQKKEKAKRMSSVELIKSACNGMSDLFMSKGSLFKFSQKNPKEIKLVCDTMHQGLGEKLRSCGIDTLILQNHESHTMAGTYALKENRYVITHGKCYNLIASLIPSGHCLGLTSGHIADQIREVLTHFNVNVTEDNLFTYCSKCNGNKFIEMPGPELRKLAVDFGRYAPQIHDECLENYTAYQNGLIEVVLNEENQPLSSRHWTLLAKTDLVIDEKKQTVFTKFGAFVNLGKIPSEVYDSVDSIYICAVCGKPYWIGEQFRRGLKKQGNTAPPLAEETPPENKNES